MLGMVDALANTQTSGRALAGWDLVSGWQTHGRTRRWRVDALEGARVNGRVGGRAGARAG